MPPAAAGASLGSREAGAARHEPPARPWVRLAGPSATGDPNQNRGNDGRSISTARLSAVRAAVSRRPSGGRPQRRFPGAPSRLAPGWPPDDTGMLGW